MESERRNDNEDSYADMEASAVADAGHFAGGFECFAQAYRLLHRVADFGSSWILDPSLHTKKPGECDPAFHFPGGVHRNSGSAPDSKRSAWEDL
jgi:hypothetical protein